jgi:hypothetical protein
VQVPFVTPLTVKLYCCLDGWHWQLIKLELADPEPEPGASKQYQGAPALELTPLTLALISLILGLPLISMLMLPTLAPMLDIALATELISIDTELAIELTLEILKLIDGLADELGEAELEADELELIELNELMLLNELIEEKELLELKDIELNELADDELELADEELELAELEEELTELADELEELKLKELKLNETLDAELLELELEELELEPQQQP